MTDKIQTDFPDLTSILRHPNEPNIKICNVEELDQIRSKMIEVDAFNLDKTSGNDAGGDLDYPFAALCISLRKRWVASFYVVIFSTEGIFLYSFEGLEKAMSLILNMREKVTEALAESSL